MDSMGIIRLWAGIAWADGQLHPAEEAALRRLIDASDELTPDERRQALDLLKAPAVIDAAEVRRLRPESREGVYRAALDIVRLDRKVTPDEQAWLARLRESLDLDPATIARIEGAARR